MHDWNKYHKLHSRLRILLKFSVMILITEDTPSLGGGVGSDGCEEVGEVVWVTIEKDERRGRDKEG